MNIIATAAAAVMLGMGEMLPSRILPYSRPLSVGAQTPRQIRKVAGKASGITALNARNRADKRMRESEPHQPIVNRMTNWQRTQWAKAGYSKHRADEFAGMTR